MRLLLVHGMGRTRLSLIPLARSLAREGHAVESVGYVAAVDSFARICSRVRRRLEGIAHSGEPYAVIGHSLGGLALRAALHGLSPAPLHLVMLGTPNRPPRLATRMHRYLPYRVACGESGQLLADPSFFAQLPPPTVPYTIIAGSGGRRGRLSPFGEDANDRIVAVEETKISADDEPLVFPIGHTFMMNDARVLAAIRLALAPSRQLPRATR